MAQRKGISTGTTAQRSIEEAGKMRFNTSTNLLEYYDGNNWKPIDSPPTVTQISVAGRTASTSQFIHDDGDSTVVTIIATGTLFATGATMKFTSTSGSQTTVNAVSNTVNSTTQLTSTFTKSQFLQADEPYSCEVTNLSTLSGKLENCLNVDAAPDFATNADTNIGTVINGQSDFSGLTSVAATDAEGDSITHTVSAGALPNGMSLATNGTFSGTATGLASSLTERTFTVSAATSKQTTTRQFKISEIASTHVLATGGTIATSGDYKIHTFTSPGTFGVTAAGAPSGSTSVEYLVVAGGGGGGIDRAGGGGGGGHRTNYPSPATGGLAVSVQNYPVTVGAGGSGGSGTSGPGESGSRGANSVFSTITSTGGGGGAGGNVDGPGSQNGQPGGSGGGAGHCSGTGYTTTGGSGNTPPVSPSQGNRGGNCGDPQGGGAGAGGGGAGAAGSDSPPGTDGGRTGGAGTANSITGSSTTRAGGGGAGGSSSGGSGGPGGGGAGRRNNAPATGGSGTANTGGGGGSGGIDGDNGGTGGSGIVILRYKFQN